MDSNKSPVLKQSLLVGKDKVNSKISLWQQRVAVHQEKQLINPFSDWSGATHRAVLDKNDSRYGCPVEGSKTEYRGKLAGTLIGAEIVELCHVIADLGEKSCNGQFVISFGRLFEAYTRISNKLVGMLMRARKQGLVHFEGEMLFQRRDDDVVITCFKVPDN
ncbi:actin-binding Rho-activating protein [Aplysia californica]|uniref:Actin-binding Rho-activating protein n=1 Tax=Aplysia californica TaxID=6500 RepID=A0ABM0K2N3_APLCA|nr:actin-binding Rho-activating protein [Aplysia californica]XP_005107349.1 actin-binding Rho-activating protein [Aplysia californica]XP_005107350.1 actin-binding Rho-activating protein [Aplysia californica]XP_035828036.1 actin-binding Rho-activating protein [Aplysia californica]